jgi:enoyl-CoA hydratase
MRNTKAAPGRRTPNVLLDRRGNTAILTLNRPEKLNALNAAIFTALRESLDQLSADKNLRAVILTGVGEAFSAGTDIAEVADFDPQKGVEISRRGQELCNQVESFPVPVIAAVNGIAAGGGCELMLGCHLRVAASNARFSLPEIKLGVMPPYGGTQRLGRDIGVGRAREMMLTGRWVSADEALAIGLVNRVVAPAKVLDEALALAHQIEKLSSSAIRACLKAVTVGIELPFEEGLALERQLFSELFATADAREGTRAFLEKREPRFNQ